MDKRHSALAILLALFIALAITPPAFADPPCPDTSYHAGDCPLTDGFDTDDDGWNAHGSSSQLWMESKTFGLVFQSSAAGVLKITPAYGDETTAGASVNKSVWVDPGAYVVQFRAATDVPFWAVWHNYDLRVYVSREDMAGQTVIGLWTDGQTRENFVVMQTEQFTITTASTIRVQISTNDFTGSPGSLFLDDVIVSRVRSASPPNNPLTPVPPTYTPAPTSPPQATAVATNEPPACVDDDLEDLVPLANRWAYINDGDAVNLREWQRTAAGVTVANNANYPGSEGRAIGLPYSSGAFDSRPALVFSRTTTLPVPFYVTFYAQASSVGVGQTASVSVWVNDGAAWAAAYTQTVSSNSWATGHFTITTPSPTYQVAFVAQRSDTPGSGQVYVDVLYLYGHEYLAVRCDGSYPSVTVGATGSVPVPNNPDDGELLNVLAGKPCPPDILQPNNFWGPILSNLTLWLDRLTALWPGHTPGTMTGVFADLTSSPVWIYFDVAASVFDFRIPATIISILLGMEALRAVWSLWMFLKRTIPFLGGG